MELIKSEDLEVAEIEQVEFPPCTVKEIAEIFEQMVEKVKEYDALGIAAPQVGIFKKMAIVRFGGEKEDSLIPIMNPMYFPQSSRIKITEGCLSYEGNFTVKRYKSIKVRFLTLNPGKTVIVPVEMKLKGKDAIVFQHETDHCNGITCAIKGRKRL